jgi:hypothetical protein
MNSFAKIRIFDFFGISFLLNMSTTNQESHQNYMYL